MKRLFILIAVCMIGMVLPQGMWADTYTADGVTIVVNGKTVTITTTKAGALDNYLSSGSAAQAIAAIQAANGDGSSIVFDGKFNKDDIEELGRQNCAVQKKVDMAEAKFIKQQGGGGDENQQYVFYHTQEPSGHAGPQDPKHWVVGATKYKSDKSSTWNLTEIEENQIEQGHNWEVRNVLADDAASININYEVYLKLPISLNYYQLIVETDQNNNPIRRWQQLSSLTPEQKEVVQEAQSQYTDADLESIKNNYSANDIIQIRPADCQFRFFKNNAPFIWVVDGYNDGDKVSSDYYTSNPNIDEATAPTGYGQTIYAGGTEYVFDKGQWTAVSQSSGEGDEEYDYKEMKFDIWKNTVEEIITSKHVGPNDDLRPDLLGDGFSHLTTLTLGSGKIKKLGNNINTLTTVNVLKDVLQLGEGNDGTFKSITSLTTLNFEEGGTSPLIIGKSCFEGCSGLTGIVSLPKRLKELGSSSFKNTTNIEEVAFNEPSNLETIYSETFEGSGIKRVTIPSSVTLIETNAFQGNTNTTRLETIRFQDNNSKPLIIKTMAFQNCVKIKDVYVEVDPDDRVLVCEYNAFPFDAMEAQTQVGEDMATLHFKKDDFEFYGGEWKKGSTFTQSDLNAFKDGLEVTVDGQKYVYAYSQDPNPHTNNVQYDKIDTNTDANGKIDGYYHPANYPNERYAPANGWQQFAKTSSGIDIIVPKGKFYRTYSTPVAQVKPDWMHIYRVLDFSDGFVEGESDASSREQADNATKAASTEELLFSATASEDNGGKTYYCIPANTGVIRVDVREENAIYYFLDWEHTPVANDYDEAWEYPYKVKAADVGGNESDDNTKVNYLMPTNDSEVTIGPVVKSGNTITHRIFGLLKTTKSGVVPQFSRAKVGTKLGDHRAYLQLPANVFHWRDENSGSNQNATGNDVVVSESSYSKISLFIEEDWGIVEHGIATEIINSIEEDMYKNDSFYTLQGVKVAKPTTKGVYIHNGKKILIK